MFRNYCVKFIKISLLFHAGDFTLLIIRRLILPQQTPPFGELSPIPGEPYPRPFNDND